MYQAASSACERLMPATAACAVAGSPLPAAASCTAARLHGCREVVLLQAAALLREASAREAAAGKGKEWRCLAAAAAEPVATGPRLTAAPVAQCPQNPPKTFVRTQTRSPGERASEERAAAAVGSLSAGAAACMFIRAAIGARWGLRWCRWRHGTAAALRSTRQGAWEACNLH